MTPFLLDEISADETSLRQLWLRGGFPRSFLAENDLDSFEWRQDFILTFLEHDIPSMGFRIPAGNMRRFWTMLAHCNGQVLNRSKLGESIGVSHHTVQHHLDILVDSFMLRILEPFEANVRKRLVKSPKIYFRDTGIFHTQLGIRTSKNLFSHPTYGSSWKSFALESICSHPAVTKRFRTYFYSVHSGGEIDLILDDGINRIAVEFKSSSAPEVPPLLAGALEDTGISTAWIVAPVNSVYPAGKGIMVGAPGDAVAYLSSLS